MLQCFVKPAPPAIVGNQAVHMNSQHTSAPSQTLTHNMGLDARKQKDALIDDTYDGMLNIHPMTASETTLDAERT